MGERKMARKKRDEYSERRSPAANFLYFIVVLALLALLGGMYLINRKKNADFTETRRTAAAQETLRTLEARAGGPDVVDSVVDDALAD